MPERLFGSPYRVTIVVGYKVGMTWIKMFHHPAMASSLSRIMEHHMHKSTQPVYHPKWSPCTAMPAFHRGGQRQADGLSPSSSRSSSSRQSRSLPQSPSPSSLSMNQITHGAAASDAAVGGLIGIGPIGGSPATDDDRLPRCCVATRG